MADPRFGLPAINWPQVNQIAGQLNPLQTTGELMLDLLTAGPQVNFGNIGSGQPIIGGQMNPWPWQPGSHFRGGPGAVSPSQFLFGVGGNNQPQAAAPAKPASQTPYTFNLATGSNLLNMGNVQAPAVSSAPPIAPVLTLAAALGARPTSLDRDPKKNESVGGAKNSWHLRRGHAADLVPPKGMTTAQLKEQLEASGMQFAELLDEGDHVHVAVAKGSGQRDPFTLPAVPLMDPALANTMPGPRRPSRLNLPDVPDQQPNAPRPLEEEIPVETYMEQLRAFAPKAFDEKAANEGRIGHVLAGLAAGAASVDAKQGISAVLAAMGAGASRAQAEWVQMVRGEKKEADNAVRMFELGLARQGIDWKMGNSRTRTANRERQWQDAVDANRTAFENKLADYRNEVQEVITNNGLDNQYLRDVDQAAQNRWRFGMQIMESNITSTRQQLLGQAELDLKRFIYEDEKATKGISDDVAKVVNQMLAAQGMDPKIIAANKDVVGLNAMQAFGYMAAKNNNAAINSLGRELVLSGRFDLIADKKLRSELEVLAKQDPELAAAAAGRALNEDEASEPGAVAGLAKIMGAQGLPVGTAFARYYGQPKR